MMIIVDFGAFLGCRLKSTMILLSIDICLFIFSPVKDKILTNDRWGGDTFCKHGGFWTCSDRFHPGVYREREKEREREREREIERGESCAVHDDFQINKEE